MFPISVKTVKTLLNIESPQFDDYLEMMLPITIALVEKHCNNTFAVRNEIDGTFIKSNDGYLISEMGLILVIAKIIEFYLTKAGISYEAVGRMTYTYAKDLPQPILDSLKSYSKSKLKFF